MNDSKISHYLENRDRLKDLSANVKLLMQMGKIQASTVNDGLIELYRKEADHSEFKTFNEWKKLGKSIMKGSKAFLVWGAPKDVNRLDESSTEKGTEDPAESDEYKYWPICYLFSDKQVTERSAV
jgi:hypothetical protein